MKKLKEKKGVIIVGSEIIQVLILLGIIIFVKKMGLRTFGRRKKMKSYISVTENEKRKIMLTVEEKKLGIFDKKKTYELKYIKVKNNIKEVKEYFDIVLKDREYLLNEISSSQFFDFKKRAVLYLRDKISIRFLPETELKSVIREMINLNIVELEKNDFNSFTEKLTYGRLIRELGKSKEEK